MIKFKHIIIITKTTNRFSYYIFMYNLNYIVLFNIYLFSDIIILFRFNFIYFWMKLHDFKLLEYNEWKKKTLYFKLIINIKTI